MSKRLEISDNFWKIINKIQEKEEKTVDDILNEIFITGLKKQFLVKIVDENNEKQEQKEPDMNSNKFMKIINKLRTIEEKLDTIFSILTQQEEPDENKIEVGGSILKIQEEPEQEIYIQDFIPFDDYF